MRKINFTKMHGCGNDYVYVNCFDGGNLANVSQAELSEIAVKISDRHFGIGSDGMILIEPAKNPQADAFMNMFNSDGSRGKMCGNGIRCVAKYIYDHGIIPSSRKNTIIETPAGLRKIALEIHGGKVTAASVSMGVAKIDSDLPEKICVDNMNLEFVGVNVGNPHAVYFLEDNAILGNLRELDLLRLGKYFENHVRFPERVNSEFVEKLPGEKTELNFRVWERGSGETLACGTGATAAAFAAVKLGIFPRNHDVTIHLLGGDLRINILDDDECVMTGEAVEVFDGEIML